MSGWAGWAGGKGGSGSGTVTSVNDIDPDSEGNVALDASDIPGSVLTVNDIGPTDGNVPLTASDIPGTVISVNNIDPTDGNVPLAASDIPDSVLTVNHISPDGDGNVTIPTAGGVSTVNDIGPDENGNVELTASDVGADTAGAAATAQTNAEAYTDTQIGAITPASIGADVAGAADTAQSNAEAYTDTQIGDIPSDGAAGTPSLRSLGTTASVACAGNDSRLSNTRTPTVIPTSITASATFTNSSVNVFFLCDNTSDIVLTLPATGITVGYTFFVQQRGTGAVTFAAASGATINSTGLTIAAQYAGAGIVCTDTGEYSIVGALS